MLHVSSLQKLARFGALQKSTGLFSGLPPRGCESFALIIQHCPGKRFSKIEFIFFKAGSNDVA
jgi:hypothetical protein